MHLPTRLILILTFYYSVYNTAQYKPSINYTTSNGLPKNAVRALFLDKNEDVWIGSKNGISKLENGAFSNLILPKTIKNNSCWDIAQDRNGNLWFASYGGGVYKYDVLQFTVFDKQKGLPVRPTKDMSKEALFNISSNHSSFKNLKTLDLFARTGNISYEFASRGSTPITSVDGDFACVKFIKQVASEYAFNIATTKSDVFAYLEKCKTSYNIIFADPPYGLDQKKLESIVMLVFDKELLTKMA